MNVSRNVRIAVVKRRRDGGLTSPKDVRYMTLGAFLDKHKADAASIERAIDFAVPRDRPGVAWHAYIDLGSGQYDIRKDEHWGSRKAMRGFYADRRGARQRRPSGVLRTLRARDRRQAESQRARDSRSAGEGVRAP